MYVTLRIRELFNKLLCTNICMHMLYVLYIFIYVYKSNYGDSAKASKNMYRKVHMMSL